MQGYGTEKYAGRLDSWIVHCGKCVEGLVCPQICILYINVIILCMFMHSMVCSAYDCSCIFKMDNTLRLLKTSVKGAPSYS